MQREQKNSNFVLHGLTPQGTDPALCLTWRSLVGLTLIELLLALGLFSFITGIAIPVGLDSYRNYVFSTERLQIVSILRRAQHLAIANHYESPYGVIFQSNDYTFFRGASYASRVAGFDERYLYGGDFSVTSTPAEIVFSNLSGASSGSAMITMSNSQLTNMITINKHGAISY